MKTINPIADLPRVSQFMGVWADKTRDFGAIQVRILGYSAYNAMGLIGSECNGIAILNDTEKSVITDEIGKQDSGYFGPSEKQKALFDEIVNCDEEKFKEWCFRGRSRIA
jgi:hypothetical protein